MTTQIDASPSTVRSDQPDLLALRDGVPQLWARYTDLVIERGRGRGSRPSTASVTSTTRRASAWSTPVTLIRA